MAMKKFYRWFVSTACFLFLIGCSEKKESVFGEGQQIQDYYSKIRNSNETDSLKSVKLIRLLDSISDPSVKDNLIIDSVFDYIFSRWLANPESFSNIPSTFSAASTNNKLSEHNRMSASLYLSLSYYIEYKIQKMDSLLSKIIPHENEMDDANKILLYRNLGLQLNIKNQSQEATTVFQKALDLAKTHPNFSNCELGNIYCNFASVFLKLNDNKKALELLNKAYTLLSENNCNSNDLQAAIINIGVAYSNLHNNDSAIGYYKKQLPLMTNNSTRNYMMSFIAYLNIGGDYVEEKNYDSARAYFSQAYAIKEKIKDDNLLILLNIFSAVSDAPVKDVSKEITEIKGYINLFYKNNDLYDVQNAYEALNKIALIKNQYRDALIYLQKLDSIKDFVTSAENKKLVNELELKYHSAEKDLEINKQQTEIKQSRNLSYFLMASFLIIVLLSILSIKTIKERKERESQKMRDNFTQQLLDGNENERERIASELHDNINQKLVLLKKENLFTNPVISEKIEGIINNIRNIARNLYPVSLPHIGLQYSIEYLCEETKAKTELNIHSEIKYKEPIQNKKTELHLFRIVQEAINNCIKHAQASEAKVVFTEDIKTKKIILEIKDNGKGFSVSASLKSKDSFGLYSIMQHCKAIDAICSLQSTDDGTYISISIPCSSLTIS